MEGLMEYHLILSPRLNLTPDDFVAAWNEETVHIAAAEANITAGQAQTYNPWVDLVTLVLTTVGLGLGTNALYDLIKKIFEKKGQKKHIKIVEQDLPGGAHYLTIDIDEG